MLTRREVHRFLPGDELGSYYGAERGGKEGSETMVEGQG